MKLFQFTKTASIFFALIASFSYAQDTQNKFLILQIFKNGQPLTNEIGQTSTTGRTIHLGTVNSKGQLRIDCNGAEPKSMAVEMRDRGVEFRSLVTNNELKVEVSISDFVEQQLPKDGKLPACMPIQVPKQQNYSYTSLFKLNAGFLSKEKILLGDGYELIASVLSNKN